MRSGLLDLMAEGLMTQEDLGAMLRRLEETRALAERGLEMLRRKKDRVARLEQDKEIRLEPYARMAPGAPEALTSEERHRPSRMLRPRVVMNPDRSIELTGALVLGFTPTETVLR